ncbi:AraC family transcriptional regulator ligand-binding domain-containing protein [Leucobacter chromiireducens]|uniref:AraC family transcriptional regulator ligand-binding domain-containing protein n=1 Tax=Leucobacter chromiireducens TaxID=283877 RepID=UPI000F62F211
MAGHRPPRDWRARRAACDGAERACRGPGVAGHGGVHRTAVRGHAGKPSRRRGRRARHQPAARVRPAAHRLQRGHAGGALQQQRPERLDLLGLAVCGEPTVRHALRRGGRGSRLVVDLLHLRSRVELRLDERCRSARAPGHGAPRTDARRAGHPTHRGSAEAPGLHHPERPAGARRTQRLRWHSGGQHGRE